MRHIRPVGVATPDDAALVMQLGTEAVFVGGGIFKSEDPERRAKAVVKAATYYKDPARLLEMWRSSRRGSCCRRGEEVRS